MGDLGGVAGPGGLDGAGRLLDTVRLVNATFPGVLDEFRVRLDEERWTTDTAGVLDRLAGALVGRRTPADGDMFHDVHTQLHPVGPVGPSIVCEQVGTDPVGGQGLLKVTFGRP